MMGRASGKRLACGIAVLLVVATVIVGSSSGTVGRGASRPGEPRLSERQILTLALRGAARAGDPHPTLIQHAQATRHKANLIDSGDVVQGNAWSYLIAERGHFVFKDVAPGASPVTGTTLTLIVDAETRQTTDAGLSNRYPKLSTLGAVETDLPHG
jgi:hypothetical protein